MRRGISPWQWHDCTHQHVLLADQIDQCVDNAMLLHHTTHRRRSATNQQHGLIEYFQIRMAFCTFALRQHNDENLEMYTMGTLRSGTGMRANVVCTNCNAACKHCDPMQPHCPCQRAAAARATTGRSGRRRRLSRSTAPCDSHRTGNYARLCAQPDD